MIDAGREVPVWAFILIALLCVLPPVWSVPIPPLLDYHNHLARQFILDRIDHSQILASYYSTTWRASPYLMFDAIVQALATLMPVDVAGKVFITLMLLLLAAAPAALNLALLGRITPLGLAGLLFVFNQTVTLGFVNYMFGVGLALVAFAVWIRLRTSSWVIRWLAIPVLCAGVFFSHLLGFVIYMLCTSSYELGRYAAGWKKPTGRISLRLDRDQLTTLVSILLQASLPLLIFSAWGPTTESVSQNTYGGLSRKLQLLPTFFTYLMPYPSSLDRALRWLMPCGLLLLAVLGRVRPAPGMIWPLGALLVLFVAMPVELFNGWGADHRLLPALGLALAGSLQVRLSERSVPWVAGVIAGLVLVRSIAVTVDWKASETAYAPYLRALERVDSGSRIFYAFGHAAGQRITSHPVYHLPQLILARRDVYVPFLFASTSGWLTLRYRPEVEPLQRLSKGPVLVNGASPDWDAIKGKFDYFLLVDEQHFKNATPAWLTPIYEARSIRLYMQSSGIR